MSEVLTGTPIRLELGLAGMKSRVFIGDVEITRLCRGVRVVTAVDEVTRVHLDLIAIGGVTITAPDGVELSVEVVDFTRVHRATGDPLFVIAEKVTAVHE